MKTIHKKTWPDLFQAVWDNKKNFDLRLNDFEAEEGDILILEEWNPSSSSYTGRKITKTIKFVYKFKNSDLFWTKEEIENKGLQIMALE